MKLNYSYDRQYDLLSISFSKSNYGVCSEVYNHVNFFFDYRTGEFLGVDVFDFTHDFKQNFKDLYWFGAFGILIIRFLIFLHIDKIN